MVCKVVALETVQSDGALTSVALVRISPALPELLPTVPDQFKPVTPEAATKLCPFAATASTIVVPFLITKPTEETELKPSFEPPVLKYRFAGSSVTVA